MINVCLVGNPNTGKTTLFNTLTSSNEHVGNWHGVTVEEKARAYSYKGSQINLIDLPGIYSLSPLSFEEEVTRDYLYSHKDYLVVNICDASNLKRNLYLTLCLLELGVKVVLVVNQIDKRPICKCDYSRLSKLLGVKIIHLNAGDKKACDEINETLIAENWGEKYNLPYIKNLDLSKAQGYVEYKDNSDFYKLKLLEDDEFIKKKLNVKDNFNQCQIVAEARYDYIDSLLNEVATKNERVQGKSKLDKVVLNRFLALPTFLLLLAGVFYLTFFSLGFWLSSGLSSLLDSVVFWPISRWLISLFGEG
ncbi:MAG: ferrous iron transporter B, partial [Clostridia bacterium]|nr:ferrous iron transporter B [Clostridia bacterium]